MTCRRWWICSLPVLALTASLPEAVGAEERSAEQIEFFEKKIRPVFVQHCYKCHATTAKEVKAGLLLDSREGLRKGGESGLAVTPGDPEGSLLLQALRYDGTKMPPGGKLPEAVIADFEKWIKNGAVDPRDAQAVPAAAVRKIDIEAGKRFWAFQPPVSAAAPQLAGDHRLWPKRPIDHFILAGLEKAQMSPSPAADRRTWLRRVTFDLTSLPPTLGETEAFLNDAAPDAEERVVERLLASPHYGERWARMWLDLARYAEDQAHIVGNDQSLNYPNAYLYRDWVIRAFNEDMPYDRFVKLQLAADLIEPDDSTNHVALGLLGLGPKYYSRRNPAVMADEWEDRVDVVGRGLLGLTVACARCHDHKYDPIPTEDYYALAGVFASTELFNRPLVAKREEEGPKPEKKPEKGRAPTDAMHIVREGTPTDLSVFIRGDVNNQGPLVSRRFLQVLAEGKPKPFAKITGSALAADFVGPPVSSGASGRRELAEAIAARENPLTARVFVNRVWALNFGRPLVGTPSNFGALGERPTHPELLDDLAVRFMDSGWSLKWLQREIVLSAAYRQSSEVQESKLAADPENHLLGRMNRRRLSVEAWRDAVLASTGRLDPTVGGSSIDPMDPEERRRTIYSAVSRLELNRLLALFDFPDPNLHADRRVETTTPLQKLFVLNSPFMVRQAKALAEQLLSEIPLNGHDGNHRRIQRAYLKLYGRPPSDEESRLGLAFSKNGDDAERWQQYAHVLLAANEMLFID